jgi:hypothetical protein
MCAIQAASDSGFVSFSTCNTCVAQLIYHQKVFLWDINLIELNQKIRLYMCLPISYKKYSRYMYDLEEVGP